MRTLNHPGVRHTIIIVLSALMSACGGDSDGSRATPGNDGNTDTQTNPIVDPQTGPQTGPQPNPQPAQLYSGEYIQLSYPQDWTVSLDNPELSAQIFAPEFNEFNGRANCAISRFASAGESLIESTAYFVNIFDDTPEPQVQFIELNGDSAARIYGTYSASSESLESDLQLMQEPDSDIAHIVFCLDVDRDDISLILDSMRLN